MRAQGNWGNALMAYGSLKKRYLEALADAPPPRSVNEAAAARAAKQQLLGAGTFCGANTLSHVQASRVCAPRQLSLLASCRGL